MLTGHDNVEFPNPQEEWVRPAPVPPKGDDQHAAGIAAILMQSGRMGPDQEGVYSTRAYEDRVAGYEPDRPSALHTTWEPCPGSPKYLADKTGKRR